MCHMELRCDYKQREMGKCRPVERGSSHSCLWVCIYFNVRAILIMASILKQLVVPKGKNTGQGSTQPELDSDPNPKREVEADPDSLDTLAAQPQSPSPEAEYDKLLVSRRNN